MKGCRSYDPSKILKWYLFVEGTLGSNVGTLIFQCMTCKMIISYLAINEGAKIATITKIHHIIVRYLIVACFGLITWVTFSDLPSDFYQEWLFSRDRMNRVLNIFKKDFVSNGGNIAYLPPWLMCPTLRLFGLQIKSQPFYSILTICEIRFTCS